jgi:hypothetical protein
MGFILGMIFIPYYWNLHVYQGEVHPSELLQHIGWSKSVNSTLKRRGVICLKIAPVV